MTGEMSKAEVTPEAYPIHFAIARELGGTVEPFDHYQGPYVATRKGGRIFLCSDDGAVGYLYDDRFDRISPRFLIYDPAANSIAAHYARERMRKRRAS